jgi:hypothetical protein
MEEFCCLDAGTQCRDGDVITLTVRLSHEVAECKADAHELERLRRFPPMTAITRLLGPF